MDTEFSWLIASTVLLAVGLLLAVTFFALSVVYVKTHRDPARKTFFYTKIALGILTVGTALHLAGESIITHFSRPDAYTDFTFEQFDIGRKAAVHLIEIGDLFLVFCDLGIIVCLAYLDRGISTIQNGGTSTRGASIVAKGSFVFACVAALLYFVTWCMAMYFNTVILNDTWYTGSLQDLVNVWWAIRGMRLAYWGLVLAATLGLAVRSVMVALRKGVGEHATTASFFFLASTALYLPRPIYMLVAWSRAIHEMATGTSSQLDELWVGILYVIFGFYPLVVVLAVLFFLGRKQLQGLWSDGRYAAKYSGELAGPAQSHYGSPY